MNRTRAYWPTRVILALGIVGSAVAVALAIWYGFPEHSRIEPNVVDGVPNGVLLSAVAIGLAVVGLAWMARIFVGPGEATSRWRYRDRR